MAVPECSHPSQAAASAVTAPRNLGSFQLRLVTALTSGIPVGIGWKLGAFYAAIVGGPMVWDAGL